MNIFSWYTPFHWRLFNVLARVFGIMAVLFAIVSCASGVYYAFYPGAAEGMETAGYPASAVSLLVGAFTAAIGIAVLRVKPYRPDLGDAAWTFTTKRLSNRDNQEGLSSWWTGEPRTGTRPGNSAANALNAIYANLVDVPSTAGMAMITGADATGLSRVLDAVHDRWFDASAIAFDPNSKTVVLRLFPHKPARRQDEKQAIRLVIHHAAGITVHDAEQVQWYDLNTITYDPAARVVRISGGVPIEIEIPTTGLLLTADLG